MPAQPTKTLLILEYYLGRSSVEIVDVIDVSSFKLHTTILVHDKSFYSRVLYTGIISQNVVIGLGIWPKVHLEQLNLFVINGTFPAWTEMRRIKIKVEFTMKIPVFFL